MLHSVHSDLNDVVELDQGTVCVSDGANLRLCGHDSGGRELVPADGSYAPSLSKTRDGGLVVFTGFEIRVCHGVST